MIQPPEASSVIQRSPLSADEKVRAEATFVPLVTEALATRGQFQVTADSLEMIELFQSVARTVGSVLQQPVVTYANGEEVVITFDPRELADLTAQATLSSRD